LKIFGSVLETLKMQHSTQSGLKPRLKQTSLEEEIAMICVGCGDKIIGNPCWMDEEPYCSWECAEASLDEADPESVYDELDYDFDEEE
jgi:hypothetical protein